MAEVEAETKTPFVRDLAKRFMKEHAPRRAQATQNCYASLWDRHLLPALGAMPVKDVRWEHFARPGRWPSAGAGTPASWKTPPATTTATPSARADLLPTIRLYDACRHTFATYAEELGIPETRRRRLMGHSRRGVHASYTHTRDEHLLADADRVAEEIWEGLGRPAPWRPARPGIQPAGETPSPSEAAG